MVELEDKIKYIKEKRKKIQDIVGNLDNNLAEEKIKYINYIKDSNRYNVVTRKNKEKTIFLIGATGYLGTYLLDEILENTNNNLIVLLHSTTKVLMNNKLKINDDTSDSRENRIKCIQGDVKKRYLGMEKENYDYVKNNTDIIVNLVVNKSEHGKYSDLEIINVKALDYIFELMNECVKSVELYHISTIGVSEGCDKNKEYSFFSEDTIDYERNFEYTQLNHNYYLTKYEAEKAVISYARNNNKKVNILRVGNIAFPYNTNDRYKVSTTSFGKLISAMLKIGIMPDDEEKVLEFTFVDDAAKAISNVINLEVDSNKIVDIYHIYNNEYYSFSELADLFKQYVPVKKMKYTDIYKYFNEIYQNSSKEIRSYINYIVDNYLCERGMHTTKTIIANDKTTKILKQQNFQWNKLSNIEMGDFLKKILNNYD